MKTEEKTVDSQDALVRKEGGKTDREWKKLLRDIKDLWANHLRDDEIRDNLCLSDDDWEECMDRMRVDVTSDADNLLSFQKFAAKTLRRTDELRELRIYAEGTEDIKTAVKCHEIEAKLDREVVDVAQRLSVLRPQVVKVENTVNHEYKIAAFIGQLGNKEQDDAKRELAEIHALLLNNGVIDTSATAEDQQKT